MFEIEMKNSKRLERDLIKMRSRALPYAVRNTLNSLAFDARKEAQAFITKEMVNRNKFTVNSIRVDRARGVNIESMKSVVGSIAPYMLVQEEGGSKDRKSGKTVAIPTGASAGQRNAVPRTRLPRGMNKMQRIALQRGNLSRAKNRKQRNAIAISMSKGGFAYLDLGRRKGIFKISKAGKPTMMHDLTRTSVEIKKTEWMKKSSDESYSRREKFYVESLKYQMSRMGLGGWIQSRTLY